MFSQPRGLSVFSVRRCDYICNMSIYDTGIQDGWLLATSSTGETVNQGSGNTYRGLLFLVFLGCGQLTGIQELSKTVIWYIPPTRVRFLRTGVRLR